MFAKQMARGTSIGKRRVEEGGQVGETPWLKKKRFAIEKKTREGEKGDERKSYNGIKEKEEKREKKKTNCHQPANRQMGKYAIEGGMEMSDKTQKKPVYKKDYKRKTDIAITKSLNTSVPVGIPHTSREGGGSRHSPPGHTIRDQTPKSQRTRSVTFTGAPHRKSPKNTLTRDTSSRRGKTIHNNTRKGKKKKREPPPALVLLKKRQPPGGGGG